MIQLKSDKEIETMREAGKLAAATLEFIAPHVKAGVSTEYLNKKCHDFIVNHGAVPAPLNYKGFPKSVCTSRNQIVCHGIPSETDILEDGDIINIDVTTIFKGFHGDTSMMYEVGAVSDGAKRLVRITREALERGIAAVSLGNRLGDVGHAIQSHVEKYGYSVVREFVGHGIGRVFHEDPQVYHYGKPGKGVKLVEGMVFTIEPMINEGHWKTRVLKDGWTAVTADGKLSAQFEHTIAIKSSGEVEILTAP